MKNQTVYIPLILILTIYGGLQHSCCSGQVLFRYGTDAGDSVTCSGDPLGASVIDDPFEITMDTCFPFAGADVCTIWISPNGFLSGNKATGNTGAGNLGRDFPMVKATSTYTVCNATNNAYCWLDYYYNGQDWQTDIVDTQSDGDICVNGQTIAEELIYDYDDLYNGGARYDAAWVPITDPGDCTVATATTDQLPNWMIAPYWVDNWVIGEVNQGLVYRKETNVTFLAEIGTAAASLTSVDPTSAFVATWVQVSYQGGFWLTDYERNTFQAVIATDGTDSFAIFNYDCPEIGGGTVGFDTGTGTYCSLKDSRTSEIKNICNESNINVPGRWVFPLGDTFDTSICEPLRTDVPSCQCDAGWEGVVCASSIDDCASNPCPSYSTCIDDHINYLCDYCSNETLCLHNSTCWNSTDLGVGSFNCTCVDGFYGDRCQYCAGVTCDTGLECLLNTTCLCLDGYEGAQCDTIITTTVITTTDIETTTEEITTTESATTTEEVTSTTTSPTTTTSTTTDTTTSLSTPVSAASSDATLSDWAISLIAVGSVVGLASLGGLGFLLSMVCKKKKGGEVEPEAILPPSTPMPDIG